MLGACSVRATPWAPNTAHSRCRWPVSGGRACGTMCVYNEPVDGASGRLAGTSDCSAAQFSVAVADQNICNQSCGNKHMDMLNLLLG